MNSEIRSEVNKAIADKRLTSDVLLEALAKSSAGFNHGRALLIDYLADEVPFERIQGVDMEIAPGQTYMLEGELGSGYSGKVMRARQVSTDAKGNRSLGNPVALKVAQVFHVKEFDMEILIPQEMNALVDAGLRSARTIEAIRFSAPELSSAGSNAHVGVVVMELIEGRSLADFLDMSFKDMGRNADATKVLAQLAREYDKLYQYGWGITDPHANNVMILNKSPVEPVQLVHIDRSSAKPPGSPDVFSTQMLSLIALADRAVQTWRQDHKGTTEPIHIELMGKVADRIRSGSLREFQQVAGVFERISRALEETNSSWSRQQLRGIRRELDALENQHQSIVPASNLVGTAP
jgi:hypothetical protein